MMKMKITPSKKVILSALAAFMLASGFFIQPAYASQVTIIVPNSAPQPENCNTDTAAGQEVFPVSVIESYDENGRSVVTRRYELSRAERPENIPRDDFTFGGKSYTLTDIIKSPNQNVEIKTVTEAVEVNSPSNKLEQIIPLLENEIPYDDGQFIGTLTLDAASISVAEAGRKTSSRTDTITRQYPNLSSRDVSLIPKTVSHNGVDYTLTDAGWTAGNTSAVDYTGIGDYYTANATYSASISSTRVTGYTVTANYTGEAGFTNADILVYEAVFMEVRHKAQIVTPPTTVAATAPVPVTAVNALPGIAVNTGQETQSGVETPAMPDADAQELPSGVPVMREISREELLDMLDGGTEAPQTEADSVKPFLLALLIVAVIAICGALFLRRKPRQAF
jgi:hypothetical protein